MKRGRLTTEAQRTRRRHRGFQLINSLCILSVLCASVVNCTLRHTQMTSGQDSCLSVPLNLEESMKATPYLNGRVRRAFARPLLALILSLASFAFVKAQVLNDPVDVSREFQKMEQVYF